MLLEKRYDWLAYPAEDPGDVMEWNESSAGLKIKMLVNPTGAEVRHETHLFTASNGTDLDAQDEYWKYIAGRIVAWQMIDADGTDRLKDVPPPAEQWEILMELPFDAQMWIRQSVHWSHRPKVLKLLSGGAGTTDTTPPTPIHRAS